MNKYLDVAANALSETIRYWETLLHATEHKDMAKAIRIAKTNEDFCALCEVFNDAPDGHSGDCVGCPVAIYSRATYCNNTPYDEAVIAIEKLINDPEEEGESLVTHKAIQGITKQIEFLRRVESWWKGLKHDQVV